MEGRGGSARVVEKSGRGCGGEMDRRDLGQRDGGKGGDAPFFADPELEEEEEAICWSGFGSCEVRWRDLCVVDATREDGGS